MRKLRTYARDSRKSDLSPVAEPPEGLFQPRLLTVQTKAAPLPTSDRTSTLQASLARAQRFGHRLDQVSGYANNYSATPALQRKRRKQPFDAVDQDNITQETQSDNQTEMPDPMKTGVEHLSGMAMDDVKVHYNSAQPAQLQASAYAQGTNIYLAPSQEKHLPHEAWHVVQQKQGRVQPTLQMKGKAINQDARLEQEADLMGAKIQQTSERHLNGSAIAPINQTSHCSSDSVVQGVFGKGKKQTPENKSDSSKENATHWTGRTAVKELPGELKTNKDTKASKKKANIGEPSLSDASKNALVEAEFHLDPTKTSDEIGKRFPKGPLLNEKEFAAIKQLSGEAAGQAWLSNAGMFDLNRAIGFLKTGKYHAWLHLHAANRVFLAYLAWKRPERCVEMSEVVGKPPYNLGISMDARHLSASDDPRKKEKGEELRQKIDEDLKKQWLETLMTTKLNTNAEFAINQGAVPVPQDSIDRKISSEKHSTVDQVKQQHAYATEVLKKILIILHAGLKIRKEGEFVALDETQSIIRALSHGGRVNIRIPQLEKKKQNPYALIDWIGITENQGELHKGGAIFKRWFGTHHMDIGKNVNGPGSGRFVEEGGIGASAKNFFGTTRLYGMNLALGGIGNEDFNGDVILPDGAHGHMFIGFTPPEMDKDGALQIGIETTAPGAPSTVGYHHGPESSEATANPESSVGGQKGDKLGEGSPAKAKMLRSKNQEDKEGARQVLANEGIGDISFLSPGANSMAQESYQATNQVNQVIKAEEEKTNARLVNLNELNEYGDRWLDKLQNLHEKFQRLEAESLKKGKDGKRELYRQFVGKQNRELNFLVSSKQESERSF